ncbi:MAG TPA: TRAM domain-containing protein [Gemmatimonadaceae bacterium]|nr:TRAM domain-containing protein [Gemmatimonadaceae bacterium]
MDDDTLRLQIDSIAAGGDGVGRTGGLVVFVPRTAPGDVVTIRVEQRGRFARGRLLAVERPSPHRVEPPCPHYTAQDCGGCQLQHLTYPAQLDAKRAIVRDALVRIARRQVELPDVRPSPVEWRYRRKLTLAIRWSGGRWRAGLHPWHDPVGIFALEDCPITQEPVLEVWRLVMLQASHFPRVPSLRGAVRLLDQGAAFVLEGAGGWPNARRFFDAVPALAALWWQPDGHRRRLIARRPPAAHAAAVDSPSAAAASRAGREAGAAFAQVNAPVAAALREHVVARARAYAPNSVVDAYAGTGDTAVALAEGGISVTAIEIDRDAASAAGARLSPPSRALTGPVERLIAGALPADVVILNPPRGGLDPRVPAAIAEASPPRALLYVSCNPATLARDLGRLPGFRIASLLGFDMFPQTAHVETVCELVPEAA